MMRINYVPLLEVQRDLYKLPRGMERFREYIRSMTNSAGDDVAVPPLVGMNPMAREHVPALVDQYLALGADAAAAAATSAAERVLSNTTHAGDGEFKISLVVLDDLKGGWTNRYAIEFEQRCGGATRNGERARRRASWLTAPIWSSEPPSLERACREVAACAYRTAYRMANGEPGSIRRMLQQEGACMTRAGFTTPKFDEEELAYTRQVIEPYLNACDMPTAVVCLFGDNAARSLGFKPLGLGDRAGLALALADATKEATEHE